MTRSERRLRSGPGRAILVLLSLPALLLGPVVGGASAWLHAHDPIGAHVHLLSGEHARRDVAHEGWHHRHAHEHGNGGEQVEVPAPEGLRFSLPAIAAATPRGSTVLPLPGAVATALATHSARDPAVLATTSARDRLRSRGPPLGAGSERSGVAALLRSSHALLI